MPHRIYPGGCVCARTRTNHPKKHCESPAGAATPPPPPPPAPSPAALAAPAAAAPTPPSVGLIVLAAVRFSHSRSYPGCALYSRWTDTLSHHHQQDQDQRQPRQLNHLRKWRPLVLISTPVPAAGPGESARRTCACACATLSRIHSASIY